MENFRTEVNVLSSEYKIGYGSGCMFLGSCFTENIGLRMQELKFRININPFGINYNPASVCRSVSLLLDGKKYLEDDLEYDNENWFSFDHHSRFSHPLKKKALEMINSGLVASSEFLKRTNFLILSWGTAWVYEHKDKKEIVCNCHKLPAGKFNRKLLSVQEIYKMYKELIKRLQAAIPGIQIIFTVSPVRHWKDGAELNAVSKSSLILAAHNLCNSFDNCHYFPSWEIAMDDLRDYRFYEADMLHPNSQMIDYIWGKFSSSWIEKEALVLASEIRKLISARKHRPFNPQSESHRTFLNNNYQLAIKLSEKYPFIDLNEELAYFRSDDRQ